MTIEQHPLQPFLPPNAKLLLLGSFPPPIHRWKMPFYYPNFQNDMWRIMGLLFFADKDYFIDVQQKNFKQQRIEQFLQQKGIAIYDTAEKIRRLNHNASDKYLQVVQATNIVQLLSQLPQCHAIAVTGEKAAETLLSQLSSDTVKPTIQQASDTVILGRKIQLYRLPSTSRAYPLALAQKAQSYAACFKQVGLLA